MLATASVTFALPWMALMVIHADAMAALLMVGYVLAWNFLPGLALLAVVAPRRLTSGSQALLGWSAGLVLNVLATTLLWLAGEVRLLALLPILALAVLVWRGVPTLPGPRDTAATLSFLCAIILFTMAHILAGDPGDGFSFHAGFQAMIVRGLEQGWPPPNLMLPDVPWAYNYGAHLWVVGAHRMTGLPLEVLTARLAPMALGASAAAALLLSGRMLLGVPWWIAALPVVALHAVAGLPPVSAGLFAILMPFGANIILSPYLAAVIFLGTLMLLCTGQAGGAWRFLALAALCFLGTGARGVVVPVLICALGLHIVVSWWVERRLPWREGIDLTALVLGLAAGLLIFFRVGTEFQGTGFVQFNGHPFGFLLRADQYLFTLPHWLLRQGAPPLVAAGLSFLVIAIFHGGFLAPTLPAGLKGTTRATRKAVTLLMGGALAGVSAFFLTEAPGYSHVSFLYCSAACMALLGAHGLHRLMATRPLRLVPLGAVLVLVALQASGWPGPAATWLGHRLTNPFAAASRDQIVTCRRPQDTALLAELPQASQPIVILLPRVLTPAHHCEAVWWLADSGVQGVSNYALMHLPGTGTGDLGARLQIRVRAMALALGQATGGVISIEAIAGLRATFGLDRPVFLLADITLSPDRTGRLEDVRANDRFRIWRYLD